MQKETIEKINEVIAQYFEENNTVDWIPAKEIMPALIAAGVFTKDVRKGLPLRKVLRGLDNNAALEQIPLAYAERRSENTYWYFVREGKEYSPKEYINPVSKKQQAILNFQNSDEFYLVNLADSLLQQKASRKHTFDSLVGNLHKKNKGRTKLPLDAYYEELKLVLEFFKDEEDVNFNKLSEKEQAIITQRKYYDQVKKEAVRKKDLQLLEIRYSQFECDSEGNLLRDTSKDTKVFRGILKNYLN